MNIQDVKTAKQIVHDSKEYIDGNIAEYLIYAVDSDENNFYQYLTDEEIEEMNGNVEKTQQLGEEVYKMINENLNFDISEFIY